MRTRKAILPDAEQIHELIGAYSGDGTLLPRTLPEICENVRDFVVLEDDGRIIGCGALHLYGTHLAEIRSITVAPWAQGKGGGSKLVKALMAEAKRHRVDCICLFTRKPDFFAGQGFSVAQREDLPDKIYKDCHACPRFHCCDEVAMVRGSLPKFAILPEPANWLVKLQGWATSVGEPTTSPEGRLPAPRCIRLRQHRIPAKIMTAACAAGQPKAAVSTRVPQIPVEPGLGL